jgi:hypothetical protein
VIIGCCPAFAVLANAFHTKTKYNSRSYQKQSESDTGRKIGSKIQLRTIGSVETRERNQQFGLETWADAHGSQEELRSNYNGILISNTVTQKQSTVTVAET